MRVGIATDHGGFSLKEDLLGRLKSAGHEVVDFGAHSLVPGGLPAAVQRFVIGAGKGFARPC